MEFKAYVKKFNSRISMIDSLFGLKELVVSCDRLGSEADQVEMELLYFNVDGYEDSGLFIFGFDFFLNELSEQEFKKVIGPNSLNLKIYNAYHKLKKKQKKIKITDILNYIQNKRKDSSRVNHILRRILIMAYYLNWNMKKDKSDFEGDSFIKVSDQYLTKLKQRFDFTMIISIYENEDLFMFLNTRGKLNLVFKDIDKFSKKEIEKIVPKVLKEVFEIDSIKFM